MLLDETALLELELVFAFVELLDAGLLELDLSFWKLEEPIESIELLEVILLELLKTFAELELDFAFAELDFPLVELLDRSSIPSAELRTGSVEDDETALVEDDDLSFWRLEELIESIELLDEGLLELELSLFELLDRAMLELEIVVLEDGSFTSVKFTVIVAVADAPDGSVTETLNVQLAFVS